MYEKELLLQKILDKLVKGPKGPYTALRGENTGCVPSSKRRTPKKICVPINGLEKTNYL
jgi:hypothetical protein